MVYKTPSINTYPHQALCADSVACGQRPAIAIACTTQFMALASALLLVVQFPTLDVFSTRAPIGLVIGWAALCSEVVHPVYKRWNQQSDDREWRIFHNGAPLEMPNPRRSGEQGWHLFLSHKWSTAQDQVQSLCPQLKLLVPSLKVWRMFKRPLALRPPKLRLGGPACRPQSRGLQSGSWSV